MNESQRRLIERAIQAAYRMALLYTATAEAEHVYPLSGVETPHEDQTFLVEIMEGARDVWRPLWRCRGNRPMGTRT